MTTSQILRRRRRWREEPHDDWNSIRVSRYTTLYYWLVPERRTTGWLKLKVPKPYYFSFCCIHAECESLASVWFDGQAGFWGIERLWLKTQSEPRGRSTLEDMTTAFMAVRRLERRYCRGTKFGGRLQAAPGRTNPSTEDHRRP